MATYRQILDEVIRKPGEVWKTSAGTWAGKRGDKTQYGLADKDKAQAYVAGKDVEGEEEPTPQKDKPEELSGEKLNDKLINDKVSKIMNADERISDLEARTRWKEEGKETAKQVAALENVRKSIKTLDGSYRDRAALLQAVGFLYTGRNNSGIELEERTEGKKNEFGNIKMGGTL